MNNGDRVWLSRESFETLSRALQNIQIRQDLSILTPGITFSGSGKSAALFLDLPPSFHGGGSEYMSYFKIVDRSDTLEQDPNVTYDKKQYRIAICDGSSYDDEKGTSNNSVFYLNEGGRGEFPYMESAPFTGDIWDKYVQIVIKKKILFNEDEVESGSQAEDPPYKVEVKEDNFTENSFDFETGILTCRYTVGRVRFPEYTSIHMWPEHYKENEVSTMKIIQDHCAGPLRMFWYISCWDMQKNEEEEE